MAQEHGQASEAALWVAVGKHFPISVARPIKLSLTMYVNDVYFMLHFYVT